MQRLLFLLLRRLYRLGFPRWTRNALDLSLAGVERGVVRPPLMELPEGRRILVLAPHADDEAIGCGGTLAKWVRRGIPVRVLFVTDGREGSRALRAMADGNPAKLAGQRALIATRRQEARAAMGVLGIRDYAFLEARDGAVEARDGRLLELVRGHLRAFRPDLLLVPFITDRHPDHRAVGALALEALEVLDQDAAERIKIGAYEVWEPIYANLLVDITVEAGVKRQAIAQYASQLQGTDYLRGILGLNQYRATLGGLEGDAYAEAFYLAPAALYKALWRRARL